MKDSQISLKVFSPGDAVITTPNTFHCGFNTGFNIAAAINFAAPGWVKSNQLSLGRSQIKIIIVLLGTTQITFTAEK